MHDVAIIGAGPIGIELHVALRQAGLDVLHLEAGSIGSTFAWWAPQTTFFSSPERIGIAGVPLALPDQSKATREQYLGYLRNVVTQFNLPIRTYERVMNVKRLDDGFRIETAASVHGVGGPEDEASASVEGAVAKKRTKYAARRIVLAIGNMHRARRLGIPGEDLPHVSHYFDDPHRYFRKNVLIVGGKNSAVEAALRCFRCDAQVTVSYRGDAFDPKRVKYWLRPEIEWLIEKGRIFWKPHTEPVSIERGYACLQSTVDPDRSCSVAADFVLLMTGYVQDRSLFDELGVELRGDVAAPVADADTMETNVPGVYVAGTAPGGSQQRARHFIENTHVHVQRITRALTGADPGFPCTSLAGGLAES